jgi:hypothetical protein
VRDHHLDEPSRAHSRLSTLILPVRVAQVPFSTAARPLVCDDAERHVGTCRPHATDAVHRSALSLAPRSSAPLAAVRARLAAALLWC